MSCGLISTFLFQLCLMKSGLSDNNTQICRISSFGNYLLTREQFRSASCAQCFYFIYAQTEVAYRDKYLFLPCLDGLIVCQSSQSSLCHCDNPFLTRYNLPTFAIPNKTENSSSDSLENLMLDPGPPSGYLSVTEACCRAADECCEDMIRHSGGWNPWFISQHSRSYYTAKEHEAHQRNTKHKKKFVSNERAIIGG